MSEKNHVPEMDFLRAFAILAVLAIHVSAGFTAIPQINSLAVINIVIDVFSQCAVPLFIFISGFLLYLKYNKNYSLKEFYLKRFWRVIPPYLVFTTFYLAFPVGIALLKTGVLTLPSFLSVLYAFLGAGGYFHLWFFLIIIELYLLYPIIVKIYNFFADRKMSLVFLLLSLILQTWWQMSGSLQLHILGYDMSIANNQIFLCRLFYFALGIYVCHHYPVIKAWVLKKPIWFFTILVAICTAITSLQWVESYFGVIRPLINGLSIIPEQLANLFFSYAYLLLPLFYTITFIFLFCISNKMVQSKHQFKWLSVISLYSFGIYLIHPFFQACFGSVINRLFGITVETAIYYPLMFVVVLALSMAFVYIVRKFPFYKYIIG